MYKVALNNHSLHQNIPEWIEVLPAGEVVTGRDGRFFVKPDAEAIVKNTQASGFDIPIDIDHNTIGAAAQGWVKELKVKTDGSIWGRVEWTKEGQNNISEKNFRYISPVLNYIPSTEDINSGKIVSIETIGLTNRPNLQLQALNNKNSQPLNGDLKMNLKELALSLGLDENASEAEIKAAIEALKQPKADGAEPTEPEKKEETPPSDGQDEGEGQETKAAPNHKTTPEGYVSLKEYKAALKENVELQIALNNQQAQTQTSTAFSIVDEAVKDGRIAPNSVDFWKTAAINLGVDYVKKGLDQLRPLVSTAANSRLETPPKAAQSRLGDEETRIAHQLGLTAEEYAQAKENK